MRLRCAGVTLVELAIYMIIVAVLALVVVQSYRATDVKARYQAERLGTDLRHMQMLALTWGVTLRMTSTAGSYSVSCASGSSGPCASSPVVDPATGSAFSVSIDSALTLAGPGTTCGTPATAGFCLDALGRPTNGAAPTATLLSSDSSFAVSASGGPTYTVTVRPLTGFALVTP